MPVDKINPAVAANIYSNVQKGGSAGGIGAGQSTSFGSMLKDVTQGSIESIRAGEKASAQAVMGKADLTDVVSAVTEAEMTLQTVVAIRDKMMAAYQEIMRMAI